MQYIDTHYQKEHLRGILSSFLKVFQWLTLLKVIADFCFFRKPIYYWLELSKIYRGVRALGILLLLKILLPGNR